MRSLSFSLSLAMLLTLSLALTAFSLISNYMDRTYVVPVFEAMDQLELESARTALSDGGRPALNAYIGTLDSKFRTEHYLVDAHGTDLVSGRSLAFYLPPPPSDRGRGFKDGRFVVAQRAADGRYWMVSAGPQKEWQWSFKPYALVAIAITVMLSLAAAVFLLRPIRQLTSAVQRFGHGELGSRARSGRRDEIGLLADAFNQMANRIERLVTGERRLLQDISHELGSPLARLKLAVKLARTAANREAALDRVEKDIDRMAALSAELVEMARMDGEGHALQLEIVDSHPLIREIVDDCTAEISHTIRCEVRLPDKISCDSELLRRAIENIIRNSIRYSPKDVPIELIAEQHCEDLRISIRDYGPGVPPEALERLFSPFYRVDEARDAASGGLGLGLAIARSAIQRHGGTVTATNANPGLRIDIVLPV
jgi:signal transduction histidine kinase